MNRALILTVLITLVGCVPRGGLSPDFVGCYDLEATQVEGLAPHLVWHQQVLPRKLRLRGDGVTKQAQDVFDGAMLAEPGIGRSDAVWRADEGEGVEVFWGLGTGTQRRVSLSRRGSRLVGKSYLSGDDGPWKEVTHRVIAKPYACEQKEVRSAQLETASDSSEDSHAEGSDELDLMFYDLD